MQKSQKNSRVRHIWRSLREKITPFRLLVALVAVIALVALLVANLSKPPVDPLELLSLDAIQDRGGLRVASRGNVPYFSQKTTEDSGRSKWAGLEIDIAGEISQLVLGAPDRVEFAETPFSARNFALKQNQADCLICLSPRGFSDAFIYSEPYYTDSVAVVVPMDGAVNLSELHGEPMVKNSGARVGALTRRPRSSSTVNPLQHEGALTVLRAYNENQGASMYVQGYSGAHDMFQALTDGEIDAVAIEAALLPIYFDPVNMRILMRALGTVDYSVAALPENQSLIDAANILLKEMRADGRLAALYTKYDLRDYSAG